MAVMSGEVESPKEELEAEEKSSEEEDEERDEARMSAFSLSAESVSERCDDGDVEAFISSELVERESLSEPSHVAGADFVGASSTGISFASSSTSSVCFRCCFSRSKS